MKVQRCGGMGLWSFRGSAAGVQRCEVSPHCQHLVGAPANISGLAPRHGLLKLAGCPQVLALPSGGHRANVSWGTLSTRCVRRGRDILTQLATQTAQLANIVTSNIETPKRF